MFHISHYSVLEHVHLMVCCTCVVRSKFYFNTKKLTCFCLGGYDGASCLSSVERFDPLTTVWSKKFSCQLVTCETSFVIHIIGSCPAMSTRRRYCRVAVLENCIYALGGFDSSNYQSSVERFDPRVGWMPMPPMTSRRSSCGVAALEYLYCIGGSDGTMCMSSGERFNLRTNSW